MVDLAEGADRDAVVDRLVSAGAEPSGNTKVYSLVRPVDIESFARLGSVPLLIAGLFAAIAMASLVHVLVVSSRSWRRDRAILSALGASSSQLRSTCRWQALSLVAFASVVAVPVGGAVGRAAWQSLAAEIGVLPEPLLPVAWLLALVAALAGVAVATAAPLERLAARHRLADSLRDRP